jgi:NADPH-dependent 2,4-dienoyl-CoA reductase/sulfur reductase-like enzyme
MAINPVGKKVSVINRENNRELTLFYDKLVVATGGVPIVPPFGGVNLKNTFTIRNINDGLAIKKFIDDRAPQQAVIVGGGYIGMEMAESLHSRGLKVIVIEKMDRVLGTMDAGIAGIVEEKLSEMDVSLQKKTSVESFTGNGKVEKVLTDKGNFPADFVILAVGVQPNTALAKEAGMAMGARGAIGIDAHMRTNIPDIYAAGDCAEAIHRVTGKKTYIPLGSTANKQGRVAGENAGGKNSTFEGVVGTAVTKIFNLEVARTGLTALDAERENIDFFSTTIKNRSRASAYPAGKPITITLIAEMKTGRLLGAQMAGEEGVAHRIDTLATALYHNSTIEDVARLDLAYAPPFATVWDPILIAANVALKKLK